ncbi:MAG: hypothetical protein MZV64_32210 [Ignavibacteriales bacterium]|nr:hypothetical protein [Ignavibacteriales bacterium]
MHHFWQILTTATTMFENLDTTFVAGKKYIKVDGNGISGLTLDYTCLQCHADKNVSWAAQYAPNIHSIGVPVELKSLVANTNGKKLLLAGQLLLNLIIWDSKCKRKFGTNDFATIGLVKGHGTTTFPNQYGFVDNPIDASENILIDSNRLIMMESLSSLK